MRLGGDGRASGRSAQGSRLPLGQLRLERTSLEVERGRLPGHETPQQPGQRRTQHPGERVVRG